MDVLDRLKLAFRHGNALTQLIFINSGFLFHSSVYCRRKGNKNLQIAKNFSVIYTGHSMQSLNF